MRYIVEQFEEDLAICEDERMQRVTFSRTQLPPGTKPGDVLVGGMDGFTIDYAETRRRKACILRKQRDLFE